MSLDPKFTTFLKTKGILEEEEASKLLENFKGDEWEILQFLVRRGTIPQNRAGRYWGDAHEVAYVDLKKTLFQESLLEDFPVDFARENQLIPLYEMGRVVTVATADPTNKDLLKLAEKVLGRQVSPVFSMPEEIEDAIEVQFQSADSFADSMLEISENPIFQQTGQITAEQLRKEAQDETIVALGRGILLMGVRERASDIHIDPEEFRVRVRYRVDGVLQERMELEKQLHPPVVSWMKIQAELDITERRKPQDGRIKLQLNQKSIDFRFSTVPTIYGEKIVMRVLGQMESQEVPDLEDLGFSKSNYLKVRKCSERPNGIFFVTGPTGSGKSTTLFSVLKWLNNPEVNIMTIEDPVEYRLSGISQIQVNKDIGLDFAMALRAFLRQDPDIILVGEIRDLETAKIASEAALTGHVVLATMHTNSSLQVVTRLIEMGVEPYLIAPAIIGALSQRLIRRLCRKCIEKYHPTPEQIMRYFTGNTRKPLYFHRAKGCQECGQTGYKGRTAIHDIFLMNPEIRALVSQNASIIDLEEAAKKTGFKSIRYDGVKKVVRGITSIEEIERVAAVDEE